MVNNRRVVVGPNAVQLVKSYRANLGGPTPLFLPAIARHRPSGGASLRTELLQGGGFRPSQAPALAFNGTPASVKTDASSPDWNISRTISHPPTNSPLT